MNRACLTIAAALCLMALLSGCTSMGPLSPLATLERAMVFHPAPYPQGDWKPNSLAFEDAWFQSEDKTQLHGWFVSHPQPRAVVLFFHGNAGNLTLLAPALQKLNEQHDLTVMTFDYRGYGRSEGKPSEQGILQDARAARSWLAQRAGVAEEDIVLMGRSLGGGVAVDLAAKDGARGLVLASTFTSLPDVGGHLVPWIPAKLIMTQRFDSLAKIEQYHGPLLQSHGDADRLIPHELGQKLFAAAPGQKQFVTIPGAGHNDPWSHTFHDKLDEFLSSLEPTQPRQQAADIHLSAR